MELSVIIDKLNSLASSVIELKESGSLTEEETKRKIIEPFFQCFGWDFTEYGSINIKMEYRTNNGSDNDRSDYCFKIEDDTVLLAEAKPLGSFFSEKDRQQLRRYIQLDDCRYGLLTNGEFYEFYQKIDKEFRKFHEIHLSEHESLLDKDIWKVLWLDRGLWDIFLILDVPTFEGLIGKFCELEVKNENKSKKTVEPEKVIVSYDYTKRPPKGKSITQKEYHSPILEILGTKNGLLGREIVNEVGKNVGKRFTKWDTAKLKFGDIRWENRVWWALDDLKKEGKVKLEDHRYYLTS